MRELARRTLVVRAREPRGSAAAEWTRAGDPPTSRNTSRHLAKERDVSPEHGPRLPTRPRGVRRVPRRLLRRRARGAGRASIASRCAASSAHLSQARRSASASMARTLSGGAQLLSLDAPQRDRRRESRARRRRAEAREVSAGLSRPRADRSALPDGGGRAPGRASSSDVRNLAILELFYSTGMRLSELQGLSRGDLDLVSQQVKVRGKGRKERIIPVGDHAVLALRNYEAKRDDLLRDRRAEGRSHRVLPRRAPASASACARVQKIVSEFLDADRRGRRPERALAAPHLRHASARRRRRSARRAGAARPRVDLDDADLHAHQRRAAEAGLPRRRIRGHEDRSVAGVATPIPRDAASKSSRSSLAVLVGLLGLGLLCRRLDARRASSSSASVVAVAAERSRGGEARSGSACCAWPRRSWAATRGVLRRVIAAASTALGNRRTAISATHRSIVASIRGALRRDRRCPVNAEARIAESAQTRRR